MQISARQIAGILAGTLLLLWLGSSTALYAFIKYRKGYDAIEFADVAFPWNWDQLRPKWGNYFVDKGLAYQEAGEWDKAFYFIRVGISKAPANSEGRLALADLLFQANDVIQAVRVLEAGLDYARQDSEFWEKMIRFLQYYQADQEIIRILERGLQENLLPEAQREAAETALAKAYFHQAEYEKALAIVESSRDISKQLIRCQIYWDQGLESLAIQSLETLNTLFPNQREIVPLLTRFYQESGEGEKAGQLARVTYLNNPYSIGAAVNCFRILGDEADAEIDRFMARVPEIYDNADALFMLANYLAETGKSDTLQTVLQKASQEFRDSPMVWFLKLEALVNAGAFGPASKLLETPPEYINMLIPLHRILFHSLALTTYYAKGEDDKGKLAMQQLFVSGHIRPATLLRLAKKLLEVSRPLEAGRILQFLLKQNPGNHSALADLIRIDLQLNRTGTVIAQGEAMLENKTMPYELKKELVSYLSSDSQIFDTKGLELVDRILESLTPSKKRMILQTL